MSRERRQKQMQEAFDVLQKHSPFTGKAMAEADPEQPKPPEQPACSTCAAYHRPTSECRLDPPHPFPGMGSRFPVSEPTWWCSRHQPKEG